MYYLLDISTTTVCAFDLDIKFFTLSRHQHGQPWTKYNKYASVHLYSEYYLYTAKTKSPLRRVLLSKYFFSCNTVTIQLERSQGHWLFYLSRF